MTTTNIFKILLSILVIPILYFLWIFFMMIWFGMEPVKGDSLKIINKTDNPVFYCYSFSDNLPVKTPFTDFDKIKDEKYYGISTFKILSDSSVTINNRGQQWKKKVINESNDKILRIFTFKDEVIKSISWDEIKSKKLWNKKYLFTLNELEWVYWKIELK